MVGPGKPIDTDRYFVICANVVGGCMGTTGPASTNPATDRAYGLDLPVITVRDMVRAQAMLLDQLGIETLFSVVGGSMGGMQVLQWAATYPERVFSALPIATGAAPFVAEHRLPRGRPPGDHGRSRLARRPLLRGRHEPAQGPRRGAHGGAHHLPLGGALHRKFGRNLQDRDKPTFGFDADFQIEFVSAPPGLDLRRPLRRQLLSLHDAGDGLFRPRRRRTAACSPTPSGARRRASASSPSPPTGCSRPSESKAVVRALNAAGASVCFVEIETDRGHDAFLLDEPELFATIRGFLVRRRPRRGARLTMNAVTDGLAGGAARVDHPRHRRAGDARLARARHRLRRRRSC